MDNLQLEDMYNYNEQLDRLLEEKLAKLAGNKKYANLLQVFRANFLGFEKLVVFYQLNKNFGKEHGETAFGEIKKFLVATGHLGSVDELSDSHISTYLSKIRKERNVEKRGRKKKSIALAGVTPTVTPTAENFDFRSAVGSSQVTVADTVEQMVMSADHQKDWLDSTWIDDEPNWSELFTGTKKPVEGQWSDYWENVWRHLYKKAEEHGLNDYERTTLQGFKKMGSDVGSLWLNLNKIRRVLKSQYGLNPEGIGK